MMADREQLQLSKDSVILLQTKESPKGTFTAYTGYDKLPSFEGRYVQYTLDGNGYVDMLYAYAYEFSSRTVFVYDTTAYSSHWNDGKPYATFKALELTDGEMKDTTVDIYYDDYNEVSHDLETIGLYEITEGTDGIWYAIEQYDADTITKITNDGNRVLIDGHSVDLDDAKIVKYTGTWEKGEYDLDWTTKDLVSDGNAFGYVQLDEDGKNVVAVYDLWIKANVTVNGKPTADVEYDGRDFNSITVALKPYEQVSAVMGQDADDDIDLTVTYYNSKDEKVTLADKGTEVAYAIITAAANQKVTGDVTITTGKQTRANWDELVPGTYTYDALSQTVTVAGGASSAAAERKITVTKAGGDITAQNLKDKLEEAKYCTFETIEVYNTDQKTVATGELANGMFVKVTSWDGSLSLLWQIEIAQ